MTPNKLVNVDVELLDEAGQVEKTIPATVRSVHGNLVFLHEEPHGPYCIAFDGCEGFWCCDVTSRERLSEKSVEICRALQAGAA